MYLDSGAGVVVVRPSPFRVVVAIIFCTTLHFAVSSLSLLFRGFVSLVFRRTRNLFFWLGQGQAMLGLRKYVNTFNDMFYGCFSGNRSGPSNNKLMYPESRNKYDHFQKHTSKILYSSGGGELMGVCRTLRGICWSGFSSTANRSRVTFDLRHFSINKPCRHIIHR